MVVHRAAPVVRHPGARSGTYLPRVASQDGPRLLDRRQPARAAVGTPLGVTVVPDVPRSGPRRRPSTVELELRDPPVPLVGLPREEPPRRVHGDHLRPRHRPSPRVDHREHRYAVVIVAPRLRRTSLAVARSSQKQRLVDAARASDLDGPVSSFAAVFDRFTLGGIVAALTAALLREARVGRALHVPDVDDRRGRVLGSNTAAEEDHEEARCDERASEVRDVLHPGNGSRPRPCVKFGGGATIRA